VNTVEVVPADGSPRRALGKSARHPLRKGDLVRLVTGTGGGWGDPRERERDLVARDLADGMISEREARDIYGLAATSGFAE
jgi:N-methylhydantoinase B